ncbi:tRNA (adenosine(37)-N6)-dimethylallyltransferase MiaA [Pseudoxanthobacter sp.]|uniref:tRNA (adenosine(37)-N6)-dimethylallyltransferase MiaA n=1 Tax=Pseudoxanthobacter sp. TaxID=1925742 RepID=UPI002FE1D639
MMSAHACAPRPQRTAILIAGPTASGKSALALRLAAATGGLVVNADAMQVYAELAILTARPGAADLAAAPHRLYGYVSAREASSAARWAEDCLAVLDEAQARGVPAIVTGGTGLYFEALVNGLSPVPPVPEAVRAHWRAEGQRQTAADLHALLAARDPEMAGRLRPGDTQRVVRALEVLEATGRSLAEWQAIAPVAPVAIAGPRLVMAPERGWLQARIAARLTAMVDEGGLEEAAAFEALGLDAALPATRAIGVRPLAAAARGETSVAAAVAQAVTDTRRYAKRQETWFRNRMAGWQRVDPRNISEAVGAITKELHCPS